MEGKHGPCVSVITLAKNYLPNEHSVDSFSKDIEERFYLKNKNQTFIIKHKSDICETKDHLHICHFITNRNKANQEVTVLLSQILGINEHFPLLKDLVKKGQIFGTDDSSIRTLESVLFNDTFYKISVSYDDSILAKFSNKGSDVFKDILSNYIRNIHNIDKLICCDVGLRGQKRAFEEDDEESNSRQPPIAPTTLQFDEFGIYELSKIQQRRYLDFQVRVL